MERRKQDKLDAFLKAMVQCGTLQGFTFFSLYLRGPEELLCIARDPVDRLEPEAATNKHKHTFKNSAGRSGGTGALEVAGLSAGVPQLDLSGSIRFQMSRNSLLISSNTQKRLSGYGDRNIGLPPASPCSRERFPHNKKQTIMLVACYARYNCPYVWLRSNHQRVLKDIEKNTEAKDNPLKLKSTLKWHDEDIRIWHILSELIQVCIKPPPKNPLEVDRPLIEGLPTTEKVFITGALLMFLVQVLALTPRHDIWHPNIQLVQADVEYLWKEHLHCLSNT